MRSAMPVIYQTPSTRHPTRSTIRCIFAGTTIISTAFIYSCITMRLRNCESVNHRPPEWHCPREGQKSCAWAILWVRRQCMLRAATQRSGTDERPRTLMAGHRVTSQPTCGAARYGRFPSGQWRCPSRAHLRESCGDALLEARGRERQADGQAESRYGPEQDWTEVIYKEKMERIANAASLLFDLLTDEHKFTNPV